MGSIMLARPIYCRFFAFYSTAGFYDVVSFLAGIAYGMNIEIMAFYYDD